MAKFLQPTISGGELAPGLRGRVDLARYTVSLQRARNFITKPTGGGAKRTGFRFRGRVKFANKKTILIPFVYSTDVTYMIEAGHNYFRFWYGGALVSNLTRGIDSITKANPAVVTTAAPHTLANGDQVVITGVRGMTKINTRTFTVANVTSTTFELSGFDTTGASYSAYTSGGNVDRIVEVATPYTENDLANLRVTQSADVLYIASGTYPIKELRRTTASSFSLVDFAFKRGPFRSFNTDESKVMTVSATTGVIDVATNFDYFDASMVGCLFYLEEKELRGTRPWASGEKGVVLGIRRRSDSKVFVCSDVPPLPGGAGAPYRLTGNTRPIHNSGRAWDGPGDTKNDNVQNYTTGVEWEFLHNTFGIIQITQVVNARSAKAIVVERLPDSLIGSVGTPANEWDLTGNGTTKTFTITGANSNSVNDYRVTINGDPVQWNPFYPGGGGVNDGGGGGPRPGGGGLNDGGGFVTLAP